MGDNTSIKKEIKEAKEMQVQQAKQVLLVQ